MLRLPSGNAICYSGYRRGQSPDDGRYPALDEIREDLRILRRHWRVLRLYDCSRHAERVLQVIRSDRLDFEVLLGAWLAAEVNNPASPSGVVLSEGELAANAAANDAEIERLVDLAERYDDVVFAVAVGSEATVEWTDHLVPIERMFRHVRRVKPGVVQPLTVCASDPSWLHELHDLAAELDFIALHVHPLRESRSVDEALAYTRESFHRVARRYPGKRVVISEAGWTTHSNGRVIRPENSTEELQARYFRELTDWARTEGILAFVFEAFDEPWKGSPDPLEPEKHWGLFTADRLPKQGVRAMYPELSPGTAGA
jgi:exo-beta-1,3-glucanase (GH17 family)